MRGEKLGANLPLFWNNDGKDRPKGQICPLAKKEVFLTVWRHQNQFVVKSRNLKSIVMYKLETASRTTILVDLHKTHLARSALSH